MINKDYFRLSDDGLSYVFVGGEGIKGHFRIPAVYNEKPVTKIGDKAFFNSSELFEVEIPDSVVKIDDCAFRGCTNLEKVVIPDSVKEFGWGIFDGCEEKVVIYCDEGSAVQDYCRRNGIREKRISEKEND